MGSALIAVHFSADYLNAAKGGFGRTNGRCLGEQSSASPTAPSSGNIHGGLIECTSQPGRTIFVMYLPLENGNG